MRNTREIKFRGISQAEDKFIYGWFQMCGDEYCIYIINMKAIT